MADIAQNDDDLLRELRDAVLYDKETGTFLWARNRRRARAGRNAVHKTSNGYLQVSLLINGKRKRFLAHRAAWALCYGRFPEKEIDHIDRNRTNNSIANLREVSRSTNVVRAKSNNERGIPRGVFVKKLANGIMYGALCNRKYLGNYETPEEAHAVYLRYVSETYPDAMVDK